MQTIEQKLTNHINLNFPFLKGKKLLVAVSGGVDSVVCSHLLKKIGFNISLAHCNFQLRGNDSELDERFVTNLGVELSVKTFITTFNTFEYATEQKLSTQVAARELRYHWFKELLKKEQLDFLVTAHHADDNLETFLINLSRGSGLEGLIGIPSVNGKVVRPLLIFSREEIEEYALDNKIYWREDISNSQTKYLRNKIRHKIIPVLKELNPSMLKSFNNTLNFLNEAQQIIDHRIEETSEFITEKSDDILKINLKNLKVLSNPKAYLYHILKDFHFTEWDDVTHLLNAENGKLIRTKSHTLVKDRDFLVLLPSYKLTNAENQVFTIKRDALKLDNPISLLFKNVQKTTSLDKKSIYVDKNLLNYPLTLRKWNERDLFYPKGMLGKKKVSKFLKDEKLSFIEKKDTWLLCSAKDEVIWIVGKRQDRRFLPSNETTSILQICI